MNNKELVVTQFGENAANYVTSSIHAKGKDLPTLLACIKGRENKRLLDIATGGGHVANLLAPQFKSVVALDLTDEMLKGAQQFIESNGHTNVSFTQGDAENLPFAADSFDTVVCRIAAHHFTNVAKFVKEVRRVLEKDGLFILIDNVSPEQDEYDTFYNFIEKKRDPSHHRALKKTEWLSLMEKQGLQLQSCFTFDKQFNFNWWCDMMNVSENDRKELTEYMIAAPKEMKEFFCIEVQDDHVQSFYTEMVLFVTTKSSTLKR